MIPSEFIDKVYEKIGKANLSNVLKLSDDIRNEYDFGEFCTQILEKCAKNARNNVEKCAIIIPIISEYRKMWSSEYRYQQQMIVDCCLMELCNALRNK